MVLKKQKNRLQCEYTTFVGLLSSLSNLKEINMTVSDKRFHNCIAQSKTSRRIMAASAVNIPRLIQMTTMSYTHSAHVEDSIECMALQ